MDAGSAQHSWAWLRDRATVKHGSHVHRLKSPSASDFGQCRPSTVAYFALVVTGIRAPSGWLLPRPVASEGFQGPLPTSGRSRFILSSSAVVRSPPATCDLRGDSALWMMLESGFCLRVETSSTICCFIGVPETMQSIVFRSLCWWESLPSAQLLDRPGGIACYVHTFPPRL